MSELSIKWVDRLYAPKKKHSSIVAGSDVLKAGMLFTTAVATWNACGLLMAAKESGAGEQFLWLGVL